MTDKIMKLIFIGLYVVAAQLVALKVPEIRSVLISDVFLALTVYGAYHLAQQGLTWLVNLRP